jgi:hypothetical protein
MVVRSSFRPRPLAVSVGSHQRNLRRQRIFGDRVIGAKVRAEHALKRATEAAREADAAEHLLWSEQMEGFGVTRRCMWSLKTSLVQFLKLSTLRLRGRGEMYVPTSQAGSASLSALGPKRKCRRFQVMSALPPKADIAGR